MTMEVRPAAEMPSVTSSAVELQEKPEGPRRPSSHDVIIFPPSLPLSLRGVCGNEQASAGLPASKPVN